MKAIELIKVNRKAFALASEIGLHLEDWKYIALYDEYRAMRGENEKYNYTIAFLSKKYGIGESSVKRLIRRMEQEVKI